MNISPINFMAFKGTGSKWGHDGDKWNKNGPKWGQNGSKWGQNGSKWGQNGSKWDRERHDRDSYEQNKPYGKKY